MEQHYSTVNARRTPLLLPDVVCNESKFDYPITSTMLKVKTGRSQRRCWGHRRFLLETLVTEHGPEPGLPFPRHLDRAAKRHEKYISCAAHGTDASSSFMISYSIHAISPLSQYSSNKIYINQTCLQQSLTSLKPVST
jgi:hypothetical protein